MDPEFQQLLIVELQTMRQQLTATNDRLANIESKQASADLKFGALRADMEDIRQPAQGPGIDRRRSLGSANRAQTVQSPDSVGGLSATLERQGIPRASEMGFYDDEEVPDSRRDSRRRSSIFSFLEEDIHRPAGDAFRGGGIGPTQLIYVDHPVAEKTEGMVLSTAKMHDIIHFQKSFSLTQSASERPLSYVTYIKDSLRVQMVAHARLYGLRGKDGLIFRGRQSITNSEMLAILASMAVPESPQTMRNELSKSLYPKGSLAKDAAMTDRNFQVFYEKTLEYRELFMSLYDLLTMVPRIAPLIPPVHKRNGHLGLVDYFLDGIPFDMGRKLLLDFPLSHAREASHSLEAFMDAFYSVLEDKNREFKANKSFTEFLATDKRGYLPDGWEPKQSKPAMEAKEKKTLSWLQEAQENDGYDYDVEVAFQDAEGWVAEVEKELTELCGPSSDLGAGKATPPEKLNAVSTSGRERLGCYAKMKTGTCDKKDTKCAYSHEEGKLKEAWKRLTLELVEDSPYKDMEWLRDKLQGPGKGAKTQEPRQPEVSEPKEAKAATPTRGAPHPKKAE